MPQEKCPSQRNRWRLRRGRSRDKKKSPESSSGSQLTLSRLGRQKPIPLGKSKYRPEKKAMRLPFCPECVLCKKKITESSSILEAPGTQEPAHFECVLKQMKEHEPLSDQQRLVYLGAGNFAVIEPLEPNKKSSAFKVVRYVRDGQNQTNAPHWRSNLAITPRYIIHVEKTTLRMKKELEAVDRMSIKPLDSLEFSLLEQDN